MTSMYRPPSPIFDSPELLTLRRMKPLPKRRRTSSESSQEDLLTTPDVPTDVDADIEEALLHLNDPNWDIHDHGRSSFSDTSSLSGQSFELEHKHKFASDVQIGHSIGTGPSEFDTESRADSAYENRSTTSSRLRMRSADAFDEYEE